MKTSKKKYILIVSILSLIILLFIGLVTKIVPNPFFDNKDLVCEVEVITSGTSSGKITKYIDKFTFDFFGNIESAEHFLMFTSNDKKDLKKMQERYELYNSDVLKSKKRIIKGNSVTYIESLNVKDYSNMNRKKIKKDYIKGGYICE